MAGLPTWFKEGTAELIQGSDERLANAVAGGGAAAVVSGVTSSAFTYEGAYAASRYLHEKLKEMGVAGGMKGLMTYLNQNASATLDTALSAVTNNQIADSNAFLSDFHANGAAYITTQMNLTNADTGAIGGLDADGGPSRNARDVVLDLPTEPADKPMQNMNVVFPDIGGATGVKRVQVQAGPGTSPNDLIDLQFSAMNARALGLAGLDLQRGAVALLHIDQAIDFVDKQRVANGASSNRMDVAASNLQTSSANLQASQGRIQDTDYAATTAKLTRSQILQQAASAIMVQANGEARSVLALLR
jgi:flagellin